MIKNIEVVVVDPEDVFFQSNWVPSHGLEKAVRARAEGKVVLISGCDCGCWNEKTTAQAELLIKKVFGDDKLVAFAHCSAKGRRVLLLPDKDPLHGIAKAVPI
jgi:hypothetical protein